MSEKRFKYDIEDERPVIYDNNSVDDYYFTNNPDEMKQFVKMINNNEEYWQEKYNYLLNEYKKQLTLNNEKEKGINQLKEENQTLYCQLNNFKLCKWDLDEENKLLKQALCETLQDTGNGYLIKIMDKLFELEYDKWESERYYEDWEETLELKKLRDLYEK